VPTKQELRKLIRTEKRCFSQQELAEASLSVVSRLAEHPRVRAAQVVMMYYSLPDEVNTHSLIDRLAAEGKTIVLPVVVGEGIMRLCRYEGSESLRQGAYGIMEPAGEPFTAIDTIDLIVVPGMAFDPQGHRLGRGKGYYDRFLATVPQAYKIGACFDFQKKPLIPTDAHDACMDEVI